MTVMGDADFKAQGVRVKGRESECKRVTVSFMG